MAFFTGLLALCATAYTQEERRDILLVEHPDRLIIFNTYQQRLSSEEYRALGPIVPMVVVREIDKLSDGITPCADVEVEGRAYYLERDSAGEFAHKGLVASVRLIRRAVLVSDTIAVLRGDALRFRPAQGNQALRLRSGARAIRVFRDEKETFVRLVAAGNLEGWLSLDERALGAEWALSESRRALTPESVISRLVPVIEGANRSLRKFYEELVQESGMERTPPSFRLAARADTVRCTIEPPELSAAYSGSLRALVPECERVLAGSGLHPIVTGGAIVISVR
ncbi:MAG TPA: hypothetical protein VL126_14795 [Bacteroidota bacterium]|nr:hypothetical protein [Bacteroidota bacterium]